MRSIWVCGKSWVSSRPRQQNNQEKCDFLRKVVSMNKKRISPEEFPTVEALRAERKRVKYNRRYKRVLGSTVFTLVVVAAVAVLVATIWMPVLQIYGASMTPTLEEGDVVVSVKGSDYATGDLVSFYIGNKLLVKRYIAGAGQWVDIDEAGTVYVDGIALAEPYVLEPAFGDVDITLPYQVPENRIFVMGDHRATSVDSRNTAVGCIAKEQIVGKIVFRVWPLNTAGALE